MHPARIPSQDEVLQAFRKAGFTSLTPLQEGFIPSMLRGRDVAAERIAGSGATVGFMLPLILWLRGEGAAPQALVIVPDSGELEKVVRAYNRVSRVMRDAPSFVPLGEIEDTRKEQRRLEKGSRIVAGTTERLIDYIRRGSLELGDLRAVIMEEPEGDAQQDFVKDVQFIFAKLPERRQTILFGRRPFLPENELLKLLHHPVVVDARTPPVPVAPPGAPQRGHLFIMTEGAIRTELLARIILGRRIPSAVVFHSPRADQRRIVEALALRGIRSGILPAGAAGSARRTVLAAFTRRTLDILLIPFSSSPQATADLQEIAPACVVCLELPTGAARQAAGLAKGSTILALVDQGQEKELAKLQEAIGVTINRGEIPSDEEMLTGIIDRILDRMKQEDQEELAALRGRIRRQVPLLQRPLFMAALLKAQLPQDLRLKQSSPAPSTGPVEPVKIPRPAAIPQETAKTQRGRFGRSAGMPQNRSTRAAEPSPVSRGSRDTARPPRPETRGGESGYTQLFVSIGRNRKVYARDLSALFTEKLQLVAGDLGGVRVFDKYSFVDIVPAKAEDAIAKLSGSEMKGRTIMVNYAKKKEEKQEK